MSREQSKSEETQTPMGWVNQHNGSPTRTLEEIAFYAGPNSALVVRAVKDYDRLTRIEAKAKLAVDALETLQDRNDMLVDALKAWKEFWDDMPKGQMGKLAFNVGLFNDAFIKMDVALVNAGLDKKAGGCRE